jgi:hypothetical protein
MSRRWLFAGLSVATLLLGWLAFPARHERPRRAPRHAANEPPSAFSPEPTAYTTEPELALAAKALPSPALDVGSASASAPTNPPASSEASLMARLRELGSSDPELTLRLSRAGNERFKRSADAVERSWFMIKSLSDLGRQDEARAAGRDLLRDYPGTSWAEDAHRHLFVNPPTAPAERGYGKQLELER